MKVPYELLIQDPSSVSKKVHDFTNGDFSIDIDLSTKITIKDKPSYNNFRNFLLGAEINFEGNPELKRHLTKVREQIPEELIKKYLV